MATKAEKLLKQLQIDGIVGATGKINANFELKTGSLNIQKQIMRPSSVGQIIEEWLSAYMDGACGHFFRPLCLYSFYNLED